MANLALNKNILENWKRKELLTDGQIKPYDGHEGFAHANWPTYCTLDLEKIENINLVRFLIWDLDDRLYKYRFLTSEDKKNWIVHYDTGHEGQRGWQEFIFSPSLKIRYIRIHCLFNNGNNNFHLVEIEAHDCDNKQSDKIRFSKEININDFIIEKSDGQTLSNTFYQLITKLERINEQHKKTLIIPELENMIMDFKQEIYQVEALDHAIAPIKNGIIKPVRKAIDYSNKIGKWALWVSVFFGIIGFFSILNSIFKWID